MQIFVQKWRKSHFVFYKLLDETVFFSCNKKVHIKLYQQRILIKTTTLLITVPLPEATKPKTTTTTTMARSSATGTTTNCLRGTAAKLATPSSTPENKPAGLHSTRTASLTTTTYKNKTQSGPATVPDTRNAYSKIGSMDIECSVKHQPRGGKVGCSFISHSLQTGMFLFEFLI